MKKIVLTKKPVILIVDDDRFTRESLYLEMKGHYSIFMAGCAEEALDFLSKHRVSVILLDIRLPRMDGITALKEIKRKYSETDVIMISAIKEHDMIIKAIKAGAYHYFTKDLDVEEMMLNINNALAKQSEIKEKLFYKSEIEQYINVGFIIGKSPKMKMVYEIVEKVSHLDANVLITGKSGTGKELLARIIHNKSHRREKPFVIVNMAALPESLVESILFGHEKGAFTGATRQHVGKFELADGGTLFLDEIGELKTDLQAKLLRVIQEGEVEMIGSQRAMKVDVRILAATNVDLQERMEKRQFREDLYFRLNVIPIHVPPLLDRMEDIPQLVDFFIEKYGKKFHKPTKKISNEALRILSCHPWPGNIRELENLMARIIAMIESETINPDDIPLDYHIESLLQHRQEGKNEDMLVKAVDAFERNCIMQALNKNKMSRKRAAASLGVPISTFKFKMGKLGITKLLHSEDHTEN